MKLILLISTLTALVLSSTYHLQRQLSTSPVDTFQEFYPDMDHPFSKDAVLRKHQHRRNLELCGDSTAPPCYACLAQATSRYCRYNKAFKLYKCCAKDDTEGICGSFDADILCSDQLQGLMKYMTCFRDSLMCGNEIIFAVNTTMAHSTTDFFKKDGVCYYKVRTFEQGDMFKIHINFTSVVNTDVSIMYLKQGDSEYTTEKVEASYGENVTYTFIKSELKDKDIFIIAQGNGEEPDLVFTTLKEVIPEEPTDQSLLARIAIGVVFTSFFLLVILKTYESVEEYKRIKTKITLENRKFQNKMGIDFDIDRARLKVAAEAVYKRFNVTRFFNSVKQFFNRQ